MVDRVYRSDLPRLRRTLLDLRKRFARIDTSTDWVRLRIDPLLAHARNLESRVRRWESEGIRGGVPMLHSDLVYLRENVRHLESALSAESRRAPSRRGSRSARAR